MAEEQALTLEADARLAEKEERSAKLAIDLLEGERAVLEKKKKEYEALKKATPKEKRSELAPEKEELNETILAFNTRMEEAKKKYSESKKKSELAREKANQAREAAEQAKKSREMCIDVDSSHFSVESSSCEPDEDVASLVEQLKTLRQESNRLLLECEEQRKLYEDKLGEYKDANRMLDIVVGRLIRAYGH